MYPEQLTIIKEFVLKFDSIQNHIIVFIRKNRLYEKGVENKQCCTGIHCMKIGQTAYVFNGEPFGLKSVFCSDLRCFLETLDESSVIKYIESIKKMSRDKKK